MSKYYNKDLKERHSKKIFQKAGTYCWETPEDFFQKLNKEFKFTLDVCANKENHKVDIYFSEEDDALNKDWEENICWMNPPYGREISKWIKKAFEESKKGALVVCLIPVRTETNWWHKYCMKSEIRFIKGRLKFKGRNTKGELVNYPATFPSAIVIFKKEKRFNAEYHKNWRKKNPEKSKAITQRYEKNVRKPERRRAKQKKENNKYF